MEEINPKIYTENDIETWDAIFSQLSIVESIGALKFLMCKYTMRSGKKGGCTIPKMKMDIKKSIRCGEKLVELLEKAEKEGFSIVDEDENVVEDMFKRKKKK